MLDFEVDTLDGVEDGIKKLYSEHNGKFRLNVKGIDPADELKKALNNERNLSKETKAKLSEMERLQNEAEEKRLAEKSEFEKLWQSEKEAKSKTLSELETLKKSIAEKDRNQTALSLVSAIGKNEDEIKMLKREALDYIAVSNDGIEYVGVKDEAELKLKLNEFYKSVKGNQASGSNDGGNNKDSGKSTSSLKDAKTPEQRRAIIEARIKQ